MFRCVPCPGDAGDAKPKSWKLKRKNFKLHETGLEMVNKNSTLK